MLLCGILGQTPFLFQLHFGFSSPLPPPLPPRGAGAGAGAGAGTGAGSDTPGAAGAGADVRTDCTAGAGAAVNATSCGARTILYPEAQTAYATSAVENSCGLVLLVLEVVGALLLLLIVITLEFVLEVSHPPAFSILVRAGDKRD